MGRLFGKRALVALVLLTAIGVAFAAYSYFYTWTKYYRIKPLTSFEKIRIPDTSGATVNMVDSFIDEETGNPVDATLPLVVVPFAIPWKVTEPEILAITIVLMARALPPCSEEYEYQIVEFLADPPVIPYWNGEPIPYDTTELALLNETKYRLKEFNYTGAAWALTVPRLKPVYHETFNLAKKSYVNFKVLTDDLVKLREHFAYLIEMIYIFHPGKDGELGTKDDYLYAIVPIPLVNPWQQPASGFAQTLLEAGEYGVIKVTVYWTKAVTEKVSGSFTIHIWAQEY